MHANLLQLESHHGTDPVRDLGLLCRIKMLRPVEIMVVNGTRSVFLICQSFPKSLLDQFGLGYARFAVTTPHGPAPGGGLVVADPWSKSQS